MKEVVVQLTQDGCMHPFSDEDKDAISEYKPNQLLRAKVSGVRKQRSYLQLKYYWVLCNQVAANSQDPSWDTREKVSEQCKVALGFVDTSNIIVKPDGTVHVPYRSISYKNLKHMEACRYFSRAMVFFADRLGVTVEALRRSANDA